jgi:hypothetical protein
VCIQHCKQQLVDLILLHILQALLKHPPNLYTAFVSISAAFLHAILSHPPTQLPPLSLLLSSYEALYIDQRPGQLQLLRFPQIKASTLKLQYYHPSSQRRHVSLSLHLVPSASTSQQSTYTCTKVVFFRLSCVTAGHYIQRRSIYSYTTINTTHPYL